MQLLGGCSSHEPQGSGWKLLLKDTGSAHSPTGRRQWFLDTKGRSASCPASQIQRLPQGKGQLVSSPSEGLGFPEFGVPQAVMLCVPGPFASTPWDNGGVNGCAQVTARIFLIRMSGCWFQERPGTVIAGGGMSRHLWASRRETSLRQGSPVMENPVTKGHAVERDSSPSSG